MADNILDQISAEVAGLSDAEIAEAAKQILARKEREKQKMTPDKKEKMKERERRKRLLNKEIMRLAKEKGLVETAQANTAEGATAEAPAQG